MKHTTNSIMKQSSFVAAALLATSFAAQQSVAEPKPATKAVTQENGFPIQLEPKDAELSGTMKLENDSLVASTPAPGSPAALPAGSGNAASFKFQSPEARKTSLYFLAQTKDATKDSWHVSLNDKKVMSNGQITGDKVKWIKIMDTDLVAGENTLVVEARETGTVIYQIAVTEPGKTPAPVKITPPVAAPLFQLEAKDAELSGTMKLEKDTLVASTPAPGSPNPLPVGSGNAASFKFQSPQARKVSLYFLAQTKNTNSDSWYVNLNDKKVVPNNQVTGAKEKWLKVMDADLVAGENSLVVEARETGTVIRQIAIMEAGKSPN